jgi:purine nucleosidase
VSPRPIIIDCDPGQDDAVCLLLALASPEDFNILGVTTVAGNVPLALTQRNARIICQLAGKNEQRVYAGCDRPLIRKLVTAEAVHGRTGIDGVDIFEPDLPLQEQHAVDFIIETLMAAERHSVTLVPTGPLTNIASAIEKQPRILDGVAEIVLMGGAMREGGNVSPSAEFNILVDPHAAKIVFECGRPITAMGLDVTHQVLSTRERVGTISALDNPVAEATAGMLGFFNRFDTEKYDSPGAPLHDPCTIAYLLNPMIFKGKRCNVSVETESELTMGHTAVDFWRVTDRPSNAFWIYKVDAEAFYDLLTERLARFG